MSQTTHGPFLFLSLNSNYFYSSFLPSSSLLYIVYTHSCIYYYTITTNLRITKFRAFAIWTTRTILLTTTPPTTCLITRFKTGTKTEAGRHQQLLVLFVRSSPLRLSHQHGPKFTRLILSTSGMSFKSLRDSICSRKIMWRRRHQSTISFNSSAFQPLKISQQTHALYFNNFNVLFYVPFLAVIQMILKENI